MKQHEGIENGFNSIEGEYRRNKDGDMVLYRPRITPNAFENLGGHDFIVKNGEFVLDENGFTIKKENGKMEKKVSEMTFKQDKVGYTITKINEDGTNSISYKKFCTFQIGSYVNASDHQLRMWEQGIFDKFEDIKMYESYRKDKNEISSLYESVIEEHRSNHIIRDSVHSELENIKKMDAWSIRNEWLNCFGRSGII